MAERALPSFDTYAARWLLDHLAALGRERAGVRASDDIEPVHRMRVASRRLRAGLSVFEPGLGKKTVRDWRRPIRRVTKLLGPARDLDVQSAFLQTYVETVADASARPGLQRLLLRLQQARAREQAHVLKAVDSVATDGWIEAMTEQLCRLAARERPPAAQPDLSTHARQAVATRLERLLFLELFVTLPEQVAQHHAMRIEAKRLRYTLETLAPVLGPSTKTFVREVKRLQGTLGRLHDCDVWIDLLPRFLDDEEDRTARFFGHTRGFLRIRRGIDQLIADRIAARQRIYEEFASLWHELRGEGVFDRLRALVRPPAPPADVVDPPVAAVRSAPFAPRP